MQVEVKEIQRKLGVTTIFVTHDQSEALSLSVHITIMSGGRILQVGTPEEIYRCLAQRFGVLLSIKCSQLITIAPSAFDCISRHRTLFLHPSS